MNNNTKRLTEEEFKMRSEKVHNGKYDYSKVNYINSRTPVCIICPEHGEFWQKPQSHLSGHGCKLCAIKAVARNGAKTKTYTTEKFIELAKKVHGNKYDYSKVKYVNSKEKVCIICPVHGEFWQMPNKHLSGYGCKLCGYEKVAKENTTSKEEFIKKSIKKWGNKYDYSKVEYANNSTKVCIICPEHGEFWQTPGNHLYFEGCPYCANKIMNTDIFITRSKLVHGNDYDYSKVEYVNPKTKVCIICPEHGEFWQYPYGHMKGSGCPKCKNISTLEKKMEHILTRSEIEYIPQKHFKWLGKQSLDFFIPQKNIGIECQGKQHFMETLFGETFETLLDRDKKKRQLCDENGVKIYYIVDKKYSNIDNTIYNETNLINIKDIADFIDTVIKKEEEKNG